MAGKNTDKSSMITMRDALRDYVSVLETHLGTLKSAAARCSESMTGGNAGEISTAYIGKLNEGINEMQGVQEQAETVRNQLSLKIAKIGDIEQSLRF